MKKTLIATAVAAAVFSGTAMAQMTLEEVAESADSRADELAAQMDSMPSVYGNIQYAFVNDNIDGGPSSNEHRDNGSTIGFAHDHEFAPGITGFLKIELEGIGADDKGGSNGIDSLDEAYFGVKGDSFGQLWIGSDDSTFERAVDEIAQYYEAADLSVGPDYTTGEGDLVQYMSPSFGGFSVWSAVQVNGSGDTKGADENSYPYQLAGMYALNGLELVVAMDSNDNGNGDNGNTYGARASFDQDNFRFTGEFSTRDDGADTFGLIGYYTMGPNTFALSFEQQEFDSGEERNTITAQALHNLSDNIYVYVEGYLGGGDEVYTFTDSLGNQAASDERTVGVVGAVYYF
jgi:predicted porin